MRSPSTTTLRSFPVDGFVEKLKCWNNALSKSKLRAWQRGDQPSLSRVQEKHPTQEDSNTVVTTPNFGMFATDSAVHLPEDSDLPELREWYDRGDRIFEEHVRNVRRHRDSQSSTRRQTRLYRTPSVHTHFDDDADFNARVEAMQKSNYSLPSSAQRQFQYSEQRGIKLPKAKSTTRLRDSYRRQQEYDVETSMLPESLCITKSAPSTPRLKVRHSLKNMRTNTQGSLDFRCVGEGYLDIDPFEQIEFEQGKEDLLRSLNISRLRLNEHNIKILKRSIRLEEEASAIAQELDETSSIPGGSFVTINEGLQEAQLIGPPGYSGFSTGERWATYQYSHNAWSRSNKHVNKEDCGCRNYKIFAAITDEQWLYIGIARTKVDRRFVVLLSRLKQAPITTPVGSLRDRAVRMTRKWNVTYDTVSSTPYGSDDEGGNRCFEGP